MLEIHLVSHGLVCITHFYQCRHQALTEFEQFLDLSYHAIATTNLYAKLVSNVRYQLLSSHIAFSSRVEQ